MAYSSSNANPENAMPVWIAPPLGAITTHNTGAGTNLLKTGAGALASININTGATGTLTFYDSLTGSGTVLGVINTANQGFLQCPWPFTTGLTVVQTGSADVTIVNI